MAARREWVVKNYGHAPFVGWAGLTNSIRVCRRAERIECRVTPATLWTVRGGMTLFGPGLTALLWWYWPTLEQRRIPWPILGAIGFLLLLAWIFWVRTVFYEHRVEIPLATGELVFYRTRRGPAVLRLARHEIDGLELTETWFKPSEGDRVKNHMLVVVTSDDERIAVCASSDMSVVADFRDEISRLGLGKRIHGAAE